MPYVDTLDGFNHVSDNPITVKQRQVCRYASYIQMRYWRRIIWDSLFCQVFIEEVISIVIAIL